MKNKPFFIIKNLILVIIACLCLYEMFFHSLSIVVFCPMDKTGSCLGLNVFSYNMFLIQGVILTIVLSFIDYPWNLIARFLGAARLLSTIIVIALAFLLYIELTRLYVLSHECRTGYECTYKIHMAGFKALVLGFVAIIINNLRLSMKKHADRDTT